MLKIRLRRMGAKKAPFYRVVVADSRAPRDGAFVDEIGFYNPLSDPAEIKIDAEAAQHGEGSGRLSLYGFQHALTLSSAR